MRMAIISSYVLMLISCKSEEQRQAEHAKAIAEMQSKVATIIRQVQADCDSSVYEAAMHQVDSIRSRRAGKRK